MADVPFFIVVVSEVKVDVGTVGAIVAVSCENDCHDSSDYDLDTCLFFFFSHSTLFLT